MANVILGIMQLISIIGISVYEFRKKSLSVFLWATLLIMFGFPHTVSIITQTANYSDDVIIKASIFVILFNIFYIFSKSALYRFFSKNETLEWSNKNLYNQRVFILNIRRKKRLERLYFTLLLISFLILTYYSFKYLGGLSKGSWGAYRTLNKELGLTSLSRYGKYLLFASSGVSLIFLRNKNNKMALISMIIIIAYVLVTGNRIIILPVLTAIILKYIFFSDKKLSIKTLISLGIMGFLTIFIVYFLRLLRIYGGFYNMINSVSLIDLSKQTLEMILNGDGELGLRNAFYHFIYHNNNFENFNKGHTYIRLLLIAFPTSILKGIKPPDFAISMGSAWSMNPYNTSYSMHPTLYGDCFANLWWFGIFLGIFWAVFLFIIDKFTFKRNDVVKTMLMVLFTTVYVIVGRGSVYNGFFIAFLGLIIILSVNLISKIKL